MCALSVSSGMIVMSCRSVQGRSSRRTRDYAAGGVSGKAEKRLHVRATKRASPTLSHVQHREVMWIHEER
jgi:hypothetical protein